MKITALLAALLLCCTGCALFRTVQVDERKTIYDPKSHEKIGETSTVSTKAAGWTIFSAKSSLATWKATQSEKTQGATVGGMEQQGGVDSAMINAAVSAAVSAAVKSVKP